MNWQSSTIIFRLKLQRCSMNSSVGFMAFIFLHLTPSGCAPQQAPSVTHAYTPHPTNALSQLLSPFVSLFKLGDELIKIMEGNVFVLQGSCFNPSV